MPAEFPHIIPFNKGLRPEARMRNEGYMEVLQNLRVDASGYHPREALVSRISSPALTIDWPYPMLLREQQATLLLFRDSGYVVTENTVGDWSTSLISPVDATDGTTAKAITAGGPWHLAAFEENYIATNGASCLFRFPGNNLGGGETLVADGSTVSSLCIHGANLVLGGVAVSGSNWDSLFAEWKHHAPDSILTFDDQGLDTNWLIWSEVGGGEPFWPFIGILNALGFDLTVHFAQVEDALKEQIAKGWLGMVPLETKGQVQMLKAMGEHLVCYTTDAVYLLRKAEHGYEPERLLRHGIAGRGAVAGDRTGHLFIDFNSEAWKLLPTGELKRLGYREYLSRLTKSEVVCSFDSRYGDFTVCDSSSGYLLSSADQLSELTSGFPTSLLRTDQGELMGVASGAFPDMLAITTGPDSVGVNGYKTASWYEVDYSNITDLESRLHYRMNRENDFVQTEWKKDANTGLFYHGLAFEEVKTQLRGTLQDDSKLERGILKLEYQDNRTTRGPRGI